MRSLAALLTVALLALAAVLATGAGAHGSAAEISKGAAIKAKPRISKAVVVAKTHRRKHRHARKVATPAPAPVPAPLPVPTPAPAPAAPAPPGKLLFASTFDGSFNPWLDIQSLASRATISTAHPFEGTGAGRFEVRPGDVEPQTGGQRSEVSGPTFNVGESIYVRDEIRIPNGYSYNGPWQLIDQLHETNWGGSPGIATFLEPNRQIHFSAGSGNPIYWQGPILELEHWYTLVYRVYLSNSPTQGYVELWWNGVQQKLTNGSTRMYGETIQTNQTYIKAGIFRASSSTGISVIEHDDVGVGTSLAAVMSF